MEIDRARLLLRRGEWRAARRAFTALLTTADDPLTRAQAAEGMAAAAWWLDDDAALTSGYERAHRDYRRAGDLRGAARTAGWLGNAALQLAGEHAVAQGWFRRAARLLDGLPECPEHAVLALFNAMAARLRGELGLANALAEEAVAVARRTGDPDVELQAMSVAGMALVSQGRVASGMRLLDEAAAAALAGETREVGAIWVPSCHLVQGCEQARDWERAKQWSERTMAFCRSLDLGSPYARCRTHFGTVLLWQGDWAGAERELRQAALTLAGTRPMLAAEAWARLGELRRRQGRREEAAGCFRRGHACRAARLGLAGLRLDEGDASTALALAVRLLAGMRADERLDRVPVLELIVRAGAAVRAPTGSPSPLRLTTGSPPSSARRSM
ncbi:MAG: hypothetical protein HOW71_15295 [Nonomuraea sp.]|nr:hypothetical protein [Nonomuraea sp.]